MRNRKSFGNAEGSKVNKPMVRISGYLMDQFINRPDNYVEPKKPAYVEGRDHVPEFMSPNQYRLKDQQRDK